jgi:phosphohistidine phosphatase SixA
VIKFLVRHAEAGAKGSWDGPDEGRPLSLAGFRQAEGLVTRMEDYPVDRILCSPTVRCQQTVEPLARDHLLPVEPVTGLGVDAGLTEILELFWDRRLHNAVLCTHGESIGRLFVQLAGHPAGRPRAAAVAEGLDLAAAAHRPSRGPCPLPVPAGTRRQRAQRLTGSSPSMLSASRSQPRTIPSAERDGVGSGRRIMRNELNSPRRPARIGTTSAT